MIFENIMIVIASEIKYALLWPTTPTSPTATLSTRPLSTPAASFLSFLLSPPHHSLPQSWLRFGLFSHFYNSCCLTSHVCSAGGRWLGSKSSLYPTTVNLHPHDTELMSLHLQIIWDYLWSVNTLPHSKPPPKYTTHHQYPHFFFLS